MPVLHGIASRLYDDAGQPIGAIESIRDITAQKRMEIELAKKLKELEFQHEELAQQDEELEKQNEELRRVFNLLKVSEEKYRVIAESIEDGIIAMDSQHNVTFFNRRAEEITGFRKEDALGKNPQAIMDEAYRKQVEDIYGQISRGRTPSPFEVVIVRQDGRKVPLEVNASPLRDTDGRQVGIIVAFRDVTLRKEADTLLKRYQILSQYANDIILFVGPEGRIIEANDAAVLAYGYRRDELLEMSIRDLRAGDSPEQVRRQMEQADKGGILFETVHRCRDGRLIPVEVSSRGVNMGGERVLLSIVRDISDRKRIEQVQQESEERFRNVANSTLEAIISMDESMRIVFWNQAAERIFGFGAAEVLEKPFTMLLAPEGQPGFMKAKQACMSGNVPGALNQVAQYTVIRKDGTRFPIEMSLSSWTQKGQTMFSAVVRDITERQRTERALRESEERYRLISENSGDVIWILDVATGRFTYVSPSVEKLRGYTAAEVIGTSIQDALTPGDYAELTKRLPELITAYEAGNKSVRVQVNEVSQPRKDGSVVPTEAVITLLTDAHDKVVAILGVSRDITERKRAEQALQASEARFRSIFEDSAVGIYLVDVDGHVIESNHAFRQMLGYDRDELRTITVRDYTHADDYEVESQRYNEILDGIIDSYQIEKRYLRKDGRVMWGRLFKSIVRDPAGKPLYFIAMVEDFTERKNSEEALSYKNKELSIISGISAMINRSHSIEEILEGTLNGSLELLEMDAGAIYLSDAADRSKLALRAFVPWTEAGFDADPRKTVRADPSLNTEKVFYLADGGTSLFSEIFEGRDAAIIVPVLLKGFSIGLMAFCKVGPGSEAPAQTADLLSIGSQLGIAIDNHTLMRTLRATSNYMAEIINESPDAILTADAQGYIISSNKRAARLLQYDMVEMSGMNVKQLLPPGVDEIVLAGDRSYVRDFMRKDGSRITLNISTSRFESGDVPGGYIITLKDLSEIVGLRVVPIVENAIEGARKYDFEKGYLYLMDKGGGRDCMEVFADQVKHNIQGLCITRNNPKKIRETYGLAKTPIVWLNGSDLPTGESCIKPDNLTGLGATIYKFLSEAKDGIVMLDGVEYLVARNSFESVLKFLHLLNDRVMISNCTVVLCMDPLTLDTRQFHVLLTEMREFKEH
ncbi:MAG: putative diguanylate cyclase [Methanocella sp. PtaU1.Bin125]|nr:MAG: putative diguanylate cyclase [Methanocella sp. PtaU1.Bin125]